MSFRRFCLVTIFLGCTAAAWPQPAPGPEAQGERAAAANNVQAPIKIVEFLDYQCPFCAKAEPELRKLLHIYDGRVQLIVKHDPLPIHPDSMLAHEAALAAANQGKFWEMHDLLFANPRKVGIRDLLGYAAQLQLDLAAFEQDLKTHRYHEQVLRDMALAQALGVSGTPTFFINGRKVVGAQSASTLAQAIDSGLGGSRPSAENNPDDLRREAEVAQLELSQAPQRGRSDAPVTIIEFSDLQCPFCARAVPAMEQLIKEYPDQVRWIFKNFPLDFHADAPLAHRALEAAGQQGKFWQMHDLLFANQRALKREGLMEAAKALDLNLQRFADGLDSRAFDQQINRDKQEGARLHLTGTPTFFINGKRFTGAVPIEQLRGIVRSEISSLSPAAKPAPASPASAEISFGPTEAPVSLTWFADVASNLTPRAFVLLQNAMNAHAGKLRLIFKNDPLPTRPESILLHQGLMAANAQGKFWPMLELLLTQKPLPQKDQLDALAATLHLDVAKFRTDMGSGSYLEAIRADSQEASRRDILGTPVFYVGPVRLEGIPANDVFEAAIVKQLASLPARDGVQK